MKIKVMLFIGIMFAGFLAPHTALAWDWPWEEKKVPPPKTVPVIAADIVADMDRQLGNDAASDATAGMSGMRGLSVIVTTPANINNLETSSPFGRQMAEEMAYQLSKAGYTVKEIRKGGDLVFDSKEGEFLLTRDTDLLAGDDANSTLVLVGTYTVTSRSIRVNMRLLQTANREIVAMSVATVPLTRELRALSADATMSRMGLTPSVYTRIQN